MKVMYIDVLILTNFIVNLSFLLLTKKITHSYASTLSLIISAIAGSFSSLLILCENNKILVSAVKILILAVQIIICFRTLDLKRILKLGTVYFLINLSYSGLAILLWNIFDKKIFYVKNMTVYFDIDAGMLIAVTVIFYVIITAWEYIKNRCFDKNKSYKVKCTINGFVFEFKGIADTGNNLTDFYYGKPVAVVTGKKISENFSFDNEDDLVKNKLHILPCSTVSGDGILYVTKPVPVEISDEKFTKKAQVCIGISMDKNCGNEEKCIFNPKILL